MIPNVSITEQYYSKITKIISTLSKTEKKTQ